MEITDIDRKAPACFPGLTQPGLAIQATWQVPDRGVMVSKKLQSTIDSWIQQIFGTHPHLHTLAIAPGVAQQPANVRFLVERTFFIANQLLQIAGVPVFSPAGIMGMAEKTRGSGIWNIKAIVPWLEGFPIAILDLANRQASTLLTRMIKDKHQAPDTQRIYTDIETGFLSRVRPVIQTSLSILPLLEEAHHRNIPFRHIGQGVFQLGWGSKSRLLRNGAFETDSALGATLSQDKVICASILRDAGLPAPEHTIVQTRQQALRAAENFGWPLVVKPVNRDRGEGVTTNITSATALKTAFEAAGSLSSSVVVERQVPGHCHRIHVVAGEVVRVVKRLPKNIKGDGIHDIAVLIDQANGELDKAPPWKRLKPIPNDQLAAACLQHQGLSFSDIPRKDEVVFLRPFSSVEWGGSIEDVTEQIHPDNSQVAIQAAELLRLTTAGVDMICDDIATPWHASKAIVNEVNYSPQVAQSTGTEPRHTLTKTLDRYFSHGACIPIDVFMVFDGSLGEAPSHHHALSQQDIKVHLTTHELTLDEHLRPVSLAQDGLFNRITALLKRRHVEHLIIVIQTTELLHTGYPFHQIETLHADQTEPERRRATSRSQSPEVRMRSILMEQLRALKV